jgi:hypothetical protein
LGISSEPLVARLAQGVIYVLAAGSTPHRLVERAEALILGHQRLYLLSQGCITGAGLGQERIALAIRDVESGVANSCNPLPSFRIHSTGAHRWRPSTG